MKRKSKTMNGSKIKVSSNQINRLLTKALPMNLCTCEVIFALFGASPTLVGRPRNFGVIDHA